MRFLDVFGARAGRVLVLLLSLPLLANPTLATSTSAA